MAKINVKVISDPVCPFCYLGKARLEKAIKVYQKSYAGGKDDTFNVTWHPYYLDPSAPKTGVPINQRLAERFGPDRLAAMQARVRSMGEADGLRYTFAGKTGHTRNAHRVMQLARSKGTEVENRVMGAVMKSYFEEGGDITSTDMLVEAAAAGGLEKAETTAWLAEGKGGEEVDKEVEQAYKLGIRGVPHFVIEGKWHVDGAQDVEEFVEQIVAAKEGS